MAGVTGRVDGPELFDRSWKVTIQTSAAAGLSPGKALETTEHDVKFKISKSIKSEPNKCKLDIYNLNEEQRNAIAALIPDTKLVHVRDTKKIRAAARQIPKGIGVKIEAGYNGNNSLIWLGDMRTCSSEYVAPDWITTLESGDGEKAWVNARVNVSFGPKTPTDMALRACVKALGLGEGNLAEIIANKGLTAKLFPQGTVISGPVSQQLTDFCRSADIEWSIQDGAIQFTGRGAALNKSAILISKDTGMIGSPKIDVDRILTVKTIMIPDIRPGRLIVVHADQNEGNFRTEEIEWTGDSAGSEWGLTIKATMY